MKTYNRLKNQIVAFDNLLQALKKARKGKKYTQSAASFWVEQERELLKLQEELQGERWQPGAYRSLRKRPAAEPRNVIRENGKMLGQR
jgi:hypothetical protein